MATAPVIQCNNVSKSHRTGRKKISLQLSGVSLTIHRGDCYVLLGPNGAGKTTLINTLLGLVFPDGGTVMVAGYPANIATCHHPVGYVPEIEALPAHLKVQAFLELIAHLTISNADERQVQVRENMESWGLTELAGRKIGRLSRGQRQRVVIAQALLGKPDLLIFDEPNLGLDPHWNNQVQRLLKEFCSNGGTVLFSTHLISDVFTLASRVGLLLAGKLIADLTVDEFDAQQDQLLEKAYFPSSPETTGRSK